MNLSQALEEIKSGKKVERLRWREYERVHKRETCHVLTLTPTLQSDLPFLAIQDSDNSCSSWVPDLDDLLAEDWQVVDVQKQENN